MKHFFFLGLVFLVTGANAVLPPVKVDQEFAKYIPKGYTVFDVAKGDLNGDKQVDYVFVIKGTDKKQFFKHEFHGLLDRNRRGLIILLSGNSGYTLALENRECFESENEDGGVYFPPELAVSIEKGNLLVHYGHGRYGDWTYKFRYQKNSFDMIGYDSSQNSGPVIQRLTSVNFLSGKILLKENTNTNPDIESGQEKFKESWKKVSLKELIKLKDISDFSELHIESMLKIGD